MSKKYATSHEWVEDKGDGVYRVGISDHAQELLGDIVFVELPQVGETFSQGDEIGVIESVKAASNVYSPLSGEVVAINDELEGSPDLINSAAETEGFLFEIKVADTSGLDELQDEEDYLANL